MIETGDKALLARLAAEPRLAERYQLEETIGRGGMGLVARATDRQTGRHVAVKVLADHWSPEVGERFMREGRLMARVRHPHVLQVYDLGFVAGTPYLVTELAPGGSLRDALRRESRFHIARVSAWMAPVCAALGAIHEHGIIHRDLKPDNILFGEDREPRVADFGVAALSGDERITAAGVFVGSLAYAAPETSPEDGISPAWDVYSTGVVLFELFTGTTPYQARGGSPLMPRVVDDAGALLVELRPDLPTEIVRVVAACLSLRPAARPQIADLEEEIAAWSMRKRSPLARAGAHLTARFRRARLPHGRLIVGALWIALVTIFALALLTTRRPPPVAATAAAARAWSGPERNQVVNELRDLAAGASRELTEYSRLVAWRATSLGAASGTTGFTTLAKHAQGGRAEARRLIRPLRDERAAGRALSLDSLLVLAHGVGGDHFYWWLDASCRQLARDDAALRRDPTPPAELRAIDADGLTLTREFHDLLLEATAARPPLDQVDARLFADLLVDTRGIAQHVAMHAWGPEEQSRVRAFNASFLRTLSDRGPLARAITLAWNWGSRPTIRKADREALAADAAVMRTLCARAGDGRAALLDVADAMAREAAGVPAR